jgi:hypothetical protein
LPKWVETAFVFQRLDGQPIGKHLVVFTKTDFEHDREQH